MSFLIEVVVNGAVHGGEFLECLHPPKSEHCSLSPSKRLVGVLGSIVDSTAHLLFLGVADLLHGRGIERKPSVTIALGLPCRFMAVLMNFKAAALSLVLLAKDSRTSPS